MTSLANFPTQHDLSDRGFNAFALNANRPANVGITKPKNINSMLLLAFATPFLRIWVPQDIPKQRNAGPLEILPIDRLRDID